METALNFMRKRIASTLLGLAFALPFLNHAWADHLPASDDDHHIEVAYVEFPPYSYTNDQGEADGIYINVTRRILEHTGYHPRFHPLPIARTYLYLKEGKIHLWPGLAEIPSLQGHVLESNINPITTHLNAWFLDGTPTIQSIDDLRGHQVILIAGYTYAGLLYDIRDPKNQINVITTPTHRSALQMLQLGRGDYLLDYVDPVMEVLSENPIPNLKSVRLISQKGAYLVPKQLPNGKDLMEKIEAAYYELGIDQEAKAPDPGLTSDF